MKAARSLPSAPAVVPDFLVENHGSIFLLRPRTPRARQTWGDATIVEHRYIRDVVAGARTAGLVVA